MWKSRTLGKHWNSFFKGTILVPLFHARPNRRLIFYLIKRSNFSDPLRSILCNTVCRFLDDDRFPCRHGPMSTRRMVTSTQGLFLPSNETHETPISRDFRKYPGRVGHGSRPLGEAEMIAWATMIPGSGSTTFNSFDPCEKLCDTYVQPIRNQLH